MRARRALTFLLALPIWMSRPALGQEVRVDADAGVSHAQPPAGSVAEPATYFLAGVRAGARPGEGPGRLFGSLYGGLAMGSGGGDWASLTIGGGWSAALGPRLGLDLQAAASASAVARPTPFRVAAVEGRPELSYDAGPVILLLRGRAGIGGSRVPGSSSGPPPLQTPGRGSHLWLAGGGTGVRIPAGPVDITGRLEAYDGALGTYRTGSLEVGGTPGPLSWSASVAVWKTPAGTETTGSVGIRVALGGPWSTSGSGGRSDPNPLVGTPPATYATGVVSRSLLVLSAEPTSLYRVVRYGAEPRIEFSVSAAEADSVAITGDFTDWRPVAMHRGDDRWTVEMRVAPGTYHFGFLVDGRWYVPQDAPGRVSDEWGRENATLVVTRGRVGSSPE